VGGCSVPSRRGAGSSRSICAKAGRLLSVCLSTPSPLSAKGGRIGSRPLYSRFPRGTSQPALPPAVGKGRRCRRRELCLRRATQEQITEWGEVNDVPLQALEAEREVRLGRENGGFVSGPQRESLRASLLGDS
jgi:hypothetical protein